MTSVASKNLYELLGNDPELDPDRAPDPPTKVADKPVQRSGKRDGASERPVREVPGSTPATGGRGGRRDNFTGNEQAIRDKNAGAENNRSKPTDDGVRQDRHPNRTREPNEHRDIGGRGRSSRGGGGYGARGMRGTRTGRDDRHSRTNVGDQEKQAAKGWGAETGEGEFADEQGGLNDARAEEKEGIVTDDTVVDENGTPADALPAEPEDKTKSYEQWIAEQAEKKAALNDRPLEVRQANEGSSKKFPEGKAFARDGTSEDFIAGSGGKKQRERERKAKQVVDIDQTWVEQAESAPRGGREGGRGGRGGGRGRGEGGRGRGEGRGGRGGGDRGRGGADRGPRGGRGGGEFRGRGGRGEGINLANASDFPSLGGS